MVPEVVIDLLDGGWVAELVDVAEVFEAGLEGPDSLEDEVGTDHAVFPHLEVGALLPRRQPHLLHPVHPERRLQDGLGQRGGVIVAEELVVEDHELADVLAEELEVAEEVVVADVGVEVEAEEGEVVEAPHVEGEGELTNHARLHLDQLALLDLLVDYLLEDGLDLEGVDLVHLRRDQHAHYPDDVELRDWQPPFLRPEVLIHQVHAREVRLCAEFVRARHFDHPVQHPSPQLPVHVVALQEGPKHRFSLLRLRHDPLPIQLAVLLRVGRLVSDGLQLALPWALLQALRDPPEVLAVFEKADLPGVLVLVVDALDHQKAVDLAE